jgi:hypothetical protein
MGEVCLAAPNPYTIQAIAQAVPLGRPMLAVGFIPTGGNELSKFD